MEHSDKLHEIKTLVLEQIDLSKEISDESIRRVIESVLEEYCRKSYVTLEERLSICNSLFSELSQNP